MTAKRAAIEWVGDIREAASKADSFLGAMTVAELQTDTKTAYAVMRALEVLGEAAKRIPPELRDRNSHIPWRAMAGIRDKLIHDYLTVDLEVVWKTVREDLPSLIPKLDRLIEDLRRAESEP